MGVMTHSLHRDRVPGSIEQARSMVAYNERILATSVSGQRRHRSERMLANVRPYLDRLERDEAERLRRIAAAAPPASSFEGRVQAWRDERQADPELEVAWDGTMGRAGKSLTDGQGLGSSLGLDAGFPVHRS